MQKVNLSTMKSISGGYTTTLTGEGQGGAWGSGSFGELYHWSPSYPSGFSGWPNGGNPNSGSFWKRFASSSVAPGGISRQ